MKRISRFEALRSLAASYGLKTAKPAPRHQRIFSARLIKDYWGRD